jgi:hypothetical protein
LAEDQQIGIEVPTIQVNDKAVNGEAAETLLDLHSTPVRAGESSRSPSSEPVDAALLAHARLAIQEEEERGYRSRTNSRPQLHASPATQEPWMNGIAGLIASYSSASDPSRATFMRHESQSRAKEPFPLDLGIYRGRYRGLLHLMIRSYSIPLVHLLNLALQGQDPVVDPINTLLAVRLFDVIRLRSDTHQHPPLIESCELLFNPLPIEPILRVILRIHPEKGMSKPRADPLGPSPMAMHP